MFTPIDPIPTGLRTMAQPAFDAAMAAYMTQLPTYTDQLNILGSQVEANRVASAASASSAAAQALAATLSAADSASSALAAAAASNAAKWVAGTYADGAVAWSPMDYYPYRRIGTGVSATDPKLDTAHWALQLFAIGLGGMSITGGTTLTATSPSAIAVTPTSTGLYAFLPDATTCQKSALQQIVHNTGEYDYGIKDTTGTVLGWIRPGATAVVSLIDNATPAGLWAISGLSKLGVTATTSALSITGVSAPIKRITIDSTRTALLVLGNGLYVFIYDSATRTWGSALIRNLSSASAFGAVLSAANQILVVSAVGSALEAVTVTISGVTATPNNGTKASATLTNASTPILSDPQALGAGWIFTTYQAPGGGAAEANARGMSLTGTTPVIGGATALFNSGQGSAPVTYVAGSVARVLFESTSGGTVACTPYTLAGTALVLGTGASVPSTPSNARYFLMGSGDILTYYLNTSSNTYHYALFKLTGTTEAVNTVSVAFAAGTASVEFISVSATKAVAVHRYNAGTDAVACITDTAGVPSFGALSLNVNSSAATILGLSGSTMRLAYSMANAPTGLLTIDCSGSTPALTAAIQSDVVSASPNPSTVSGVRPFTLLTAGVNNHLITTNGSPTGQYGANSVRATSALQLLIDGGTPGAVANESWVIGSSLSTTLSRIEAAA